MGNFQRGDQVEVCCKDEGFFGAYYQATVIAAVNPNELIVQYQTLLRNDGLGPLREMVWAVDLRPIPPEITAAQFDLKDRVDAYVNDGWWVGRVTKKKSGRQGLKRRYWVHFEGNEEVGIYRRSELRIHQDWIDGKWLCSENNI